MDNSIREFIEDLGLDPNAVPFDLNNGIGKVLDFSYLLWEDPVMKTYDITKPLTREQLSDIINMNGTIINVLRSIDKQFRIQKIFVHDIAAIGSNEDIQLYVKLMVLANNFTAHDALNAVKKEFNPLSINDGVWNCGFEVIPYRTSHGFSINYVDVTDFVKYQEAPRDIPSIRMPKHDLSFYSVDTQLLCLYELLQDSDSIPEDCGRCFRELIYFKSRFVAGGVHGVITSRSNLLNMKDKLSILAKSVDAMLDLSNNIF